MSEYNDIPPCEGMLQVDLEHSSAFENKLDMLNRELARFDSSRIPSTTSKIVLQALQQVNNEDSASYDKTCHRDTFGRAGPVGWKKSYSKTC